MSRATMIKLALPALALLVSLAWTSSSAVGPPWLSIEVPANPLDPTTRGAVLVVHAFRHEHPAGLPISGTAEGLVNGDRRTIELKFAETSRAGVYALRQSWPAEGNWILTITTGAGANPGVTLVVELGPDGGVQTDRYYDWQVNSLALKAVRIVQGRPDAGAIDAALRGE